MHYSGSPTGQQTLFNASVDPAEVGTLCWGSCFCTEGSERCSQCTRTQAADSSRYGNVARARGATGGRASGRASAGARNPGGPRAGWRGAWSRAGRRRGFRWALPMEHGVSGMAIASGSGSRGALTQAPQTPPSGSSSLGRPSRGRQRHWVQGAPNQHVSRSVPPALQPGSAPRCPADFISPLFCRLHLILGWPDI